jgi:Spy/CpxP family protein refolding chaperone
MSLKTIAVALLLGASVMPAPAPALAQKASTASTAPAATPEKPLTTADLENLRTELRSSKKQVTAATLKLTDAEATKFWPVYDKYAAEVTGVRNSQAALITEYANAYGKYDDKSATDFINRWLDLDVKTTALRAKYVPIVGAVLPGVKAATFFQIDRRLSMAIDLKIASMLPILQSQTSK